MMSESKKRKRVDDNEADAYDEDVNIPRITYHAIGKSFDRLFKEKTLEEVQHLVRRKLHVAPDAEVGLEQWRGGRLIDLEDDDDFEAFSALARSGALSSLDVRITVDGEGPHMGSFPNEPLAEQQKPVRPMSVPPRPMLTALTAGSASSSFSLSTKPKSTKRKGPLTDDDTAPQPRPMPKSAKTAASFPTSVSGSAEPSTKKRKTDPEAVVSNEEVNVDRKKKGKEGKAKKKGGEEEEMTEKGNGTTKRNGNGKEKQRKSKKTKVSGSAHVDMDTSNVGGGGVTSEMDGSLVNGARERAADMSTRSMKMGRKNGQLLEETVAVDVDFEHAGTDVNDLSSSTKPKSKKSKKAGTTERSSLPSIDVEEGAEDYPKAVTKLSGPTLSWLASLDMRERGEGEDSGAVKPKSKVKARSSKKDLPAVVAESMVASTSTDVVPKLKKRRKNTSAREVADMSEVNGEVKRTLKKRKPEPVKVPAPMEVDEAATATADVPDTSSIGEVNDETANKVKAKSKKRKSERLEGLAPTEVDETPKNIKKSRGIARPIISANTEEWDAKIKTVTEALLARNSLAVVSRSSGIALPSQEPDHTESEVEVEAETLPPVKRTKTLSKLRGPEDLEEETVNSEETPHVEPERIVSRSPVSSPVSRKSLPSSVPKRSVSIGGKQRNPNDLPCPVCLGTPFHLRFRCPLIEAGPDAIEKRLKELKEENTGHLTLLAEELEHVLRNQKARAQLSKPRTFASHSVSKGGADVMSSSSPVAKQSEGGSSSRKPTIPSGSKISEVTVENYDEGSSIGDSDDEDSEGNENSSSEQPATAYKLPPTFPGLASLADVDLEAIIRGPTSQVKTVLDDIPSRSISDSEEEPEDEVMDEDEEDDRQYRLRSKKLEKTTSSDEDEGVDPDVPADPDSREESGDESEEDESPKSSTLPTQLEDNPGTTQVGDGLNGSLVGIEPMDNDDEDLTKVALSAGDGEEINESGLLTRKEKNALLAAVLGDGSPLIQEDNDLDAVDLMQSTPHDKLAENGSRNPTPSQSPRKPDLTKRTKTQNGKARSSGPAVDLDDAVESTAARTTRSFEGSRSTIVERSDTVEAMPLPVIPAIKGPRGRGRPRLSPEAKAAREREKAEIKARNTAEKARKAEEKAQKEQKEQEPRERLAKVDVKKAGLRKATSQSRTRVLPTAGPAVDSRDPDLPHSPDKWATIDNNVSSPGVQETASMMVDQLRTSSPSRSPSPVNGARSKVTDKQPLSPSPNKDQSEPNGNPLFMLSNSQVPFPYSQGQGGSFSTQAEDTSESESDEEILVKSKAIPHITKTAPKFQRLTDIASQAMFSQDILSPTPYPSTPAIGGNLKEAPEEPESDDDDDDDTGSDSDAQERSHIPKSRRAGATLRSKKGGGLLSFA